MRTAVLDLGSNSFHLLVADVDGPEVLPVRRSREMLHLGRVIATDGRVPASVAARAVATVERFADLARRTGAVATVAVATAALREPNLADLRDRLARAAGTAVEPLDGVEEARLAHLGARAAVAVTDEPTLVLDLGGGSLELAVGHGERALWATSLPLGVGRLLPRLGDGPVDPAAAAVLTAEVDAALAPVLPVVRQHRPGTVIAVGGTVRALAVLLAARAGRWLPATVNMAPLALDELADARDALLATDTAGRAALPGVKRQRADHLHVAALVLERVLARISGPAAVVSAWGLREGVLLHRVGTPSVRDADALRDAEVERLRRAFSPSDPHPPHVAALAAALFDATAVRHGLGPRERRLLVAAARLHAIGAALALRRQQEHGAYLLEHAELRGFPPDETALLATLVRFHPSRGIARRFPPLTALGPADRAASERLLALLQVADALDAGHDQRLRLASARLEGSTLVLAPEQGAGHDDPVIARAVTDRGALLQQVLGLGVALRTRAAA
jgi:exopolyphosphatase/guanosine-5'-triphosphate,3'-diphosphate pyrophosphatase